MENCQTDGYSLLCSLSSTFYDQEEGGELEDKIRPEEPEEKGRPLLFQKLNDKPR